jgi:hypothetical protein
MTSEAAQKRQDAYDNAVAALHRVNPNAVPIAKLTDVSPIARVSQQVRDTSPPAATAASPEAMLSGRVSNMQNACATLVAEAKRKGIAIDWPAATKEGVELGTRLQALNAFHDAVERRITYFKTTTQEQRAIDNLGERVVRNEKRLDAIATAIAALSDLLPLLMGKAAPNE